MFGRTKGTARARAPLLALALLASACIPGVCTLIGCASSEKLTTATPFTLEELDSAEVLGCRNDACWGGKLALRDVDWPNGGSAGIELELQSGEAPPGTRALASVTQESDGSFSVAVSWTFDDYRHVKRGDVLRLTLRDVSGGEMLAAEETVRSTSDDYPNGEDCDKTPCRTAMLEAR